MPHHTHIDGLQHKGPKSCCRENSTDTKVVIVVRPVMWTYDICAFDTDTSTYLTISDKITLFCNDVNKTSTSVDCLTMFYVTCHKELT